MNKFLLLLLLNLTLGVAHAADDALPGDSIYQVQSAWLDQSGKTIALSSLRGKPVAVSMIYLSCGFSCPTTVMHMRALEKMLPESIGKEMQFVLVSFDAEHDTPAAMAKYAKKHGLAFPKWRFITSRKEADVRELSALIDFKYKKLGNGDFEHSFGIAALDASGRLIGSTIGATMKEEDLVPLYENAARQGAPRQ